MLVLVLVLVTGTLARDSYLEAYQESQSTTAKMDREYTEPFPYPSGPGPQYGPPKYQYGPPKYQYGPPSAPPSAPASNYVPLVPVYGPPAPSYGVPHGMLGLLDKLKFKLDLFTLGKILLKIVLFKKFVSFVAVLCLLMFIPHLKSKVDDSMPDDGGDDDDETMRKMEPQKVGSDYLNNITEFVLGAIESFSKNYTKEEECEGVFCKTQKIVQGIDDKLSYRKLAELYSREIQP